LIQTKDRRSLQVSKSLGKLPATTTAGKKSIVLMKLNIRPDFK